MSDDHPGAPPPGPRPSDAFFKTIEVKRNARATRETRSAVVLPFKPRCPVIVLEYVVIGWDVILIDRCGRRTILDDRPGVIEHAIASAVWLARDRGIRFLPPEQAGWV